MIYQVQRSVSGWSSGYSTYDIRIANVLIGAYLREDSFEKAQNLKDQVRRRGIKPNAKTWELYLDYFLKKGNIKSAVNCVDKATAAGRGDGGKWTPSPAVVEKLMQHFEQNKDVKGAEGFLDILKKSKDELGREVLESLIRTYAAAGKKSPITRRRIKMENVELSEEGKKLLNTISEE
ncbi:Pentatricopeptide repeat-containing protein [Sesamum angolense]|uniref:Pentatricopeptide repeat-containing protein n=1 Tax=Sesamum angolense TaxID=2727404 RepID=A0AAE2BZX2_9LAMI|nr:Pentatricopeptide repeat-containing protein [Sesamum angolense]